MPEYIIPSAPHLTEGAKRRRWLDGMTKQFEVARLCLVDLPDDEGPEALDPDDREGDDVLADEIHQHAACARRELRAALDKLKAYRAR